MSKNCCHRYAIERLVCNARSPIITSFSSHARLSLCPDFLHLACPTAALSKTQDIVRQHLTFGPPKTLLRRSTFDHLNIGKPLPLEDWNCVSDKKRKKKNPLPKIFRAMFSQLRAKPLQNSGFVARDLLAAERTFLAWARSGLGFIALGIAR